MGWQGLRLAAIVAIVAAVVSTFHLVALGHGSDGPLAVSRLILVESRDVDRFTVAETYRAEVRHAGLRAGQDFAVVTARLIQPFVSPSPGIPTIVGGVLEFGTVRAGQTVESRNTFTVRRPRHVPLRLEHLRWDVTGRPDIVLSDEWAGEWRITITSRNPETMDVAAVDTVTDTIGAGEPVGFSLLPDFVHCAWTDASHALDSHCGTRFRVAACVADGSARFTIARTGDSIEGTGEWQVTASSGCGLNAGTGAASLAISGVRMGGEVEPEPFSPGLLAKLVSTPGLATLIADRLGETAGTAPTSDDECARGRWRRFSHPWFTNARACAAFAGHHSDRHDEGRR